MCALFCCSFLLFFFLFKIYLFIVCLHQSGMQLYWHILENLQLSSNRADNFEAIYCTMGLLCLEVGQDEVIIELLRLGLDIQVDGGSI